MSDAFLAGTVPECWGAPDIERFVPAESFIDGTQFETLPKLANFLLGLSEERHREFVEKGEEFLSSPAGYAHTYEGFGEQVVKLLIEGIVAKKDVDASPQERKSKSSA